MGKFIILEPGSPESQRFIARQQRKVAMPSQIRASREMERQPAPASPSPPGNERPPEDPESGGGQ